MIPYGRQSVSDEDIDSVIDVLRSDWLTQGPVLPKFESAVAQYVGAQHAVAVNSATSALHIACLALDVGPGDLVWTSAITFVASANCVLYCGAEVDFVDIDPATYNLCMNKLSEKLFEASRVGKLPQVVIPVHMGGQSCDMERLYSLSQKYCFRIIEDASHAVGGKYENGYVGDCRYSELVVFSFHPVKIITTGEGGMVLTNSSDLDRRLRLLRSHGISFFAEGLRSRFPHEIWNYQQIELGFNYRMSDIHAALGLSQMRRLGEFVSKRRRIAERYDELFAQLPVDTPWQDRKSYSSYHLYIIRLKLPQIKKTHLQVYQSLIDAGIQVNLHYIPVYRHPVYERMGFVRGYCDQAEQYYSSALSIPIYPELTDDQQTYVVEMIRQALS